jgi:hypothetical protein
MRGFLPAISPGIDAGRKHDKADNNFTIEINSSSKSCCSIHFLEKLQ